MKVYVIEYKIDKKSWISNIIKFFDKQNYSHTAMVIDGHFCECDGSDDFKGQRDYQCFNYYTIDNFLLNNPEKNRTVAFEIPRDFTKDEIDKMLNFWTSKEKSNLKYGYSKLFRFMYLSNIDWFLKAYYAITKKQYIPIGDTDKVNVCAESVMLCLAKVNCYLWQFNSEYRYLSAECTYPGIPAKVLKDYRYKLEKIN